jgi:hypothetical protein
MCIVIVCCTRQTAPPRVQTRTLLSVCCTPHSIHSFRYCLSDYCQCQAAEGGVMLALPRRLLTTVQSSPLAPPPG